MYVTQNRNLCDNGKVINERACSVIVETQRAIAEDSEKIAALRAELASLESVNQERQKLVDDLFKVGFCACDQKHRDPLTGAEWIDHRNGCRNQRKGGKNYGMV